MPQFHARAAWSEPAGPGWEPFLAARAEGKGALLVSGHFGQWEAVRGMLKARGIEAGALYRPVKNPLPAGDLLRADVAVGRRRCSRAAARGCASSCGT